MKKRTLFIIAQMLFVVLCVAKPACAQENTADGKTIEQWIHYVEQKLENEQETSGELRALEIGVAYSSGIYERITSRSKPKSKAVMSCVDKYNAFIQGQGAAMLEKWINGRPLTDAEKPYRFILEATTFEALAGKSAQKKYANEKIGELQEILQDVYLTGKMSAEDMERLRLTSLIAKLCGHSNRMYCPYRVFIPRGSPNMAVEVGEEIAPPVRAATLDSVLSSPTYKELGDDFPMTEPFTWKGALEYLRVLEGYCQIKPNGQDSTWAYKDRPENKAYEYEDLLAKDKPTLLIFEFPRDSFTSKWMYPAFESLYRTYRDNVHIRMVNVSYGDNCPPCQDFFRPVDQRVEPKNSRRYHAQNPEDMARMAKEHFMELPFCTVPNLLDNSARTLQDYFRSAGGQFCFALVDKNHKLVSAGGTQTLWSTYPKGTPRANDSATRIQNLNYLEQEIVAVLENNGEYVSGRANPGLRNLGLEFYRLSGSTMASVAERVNNPWFYGSFIVDSLDATNRTLVLSGRSKSPPKLTLELAEDARIMMGEKASSISGITSGAKVSLKYRLKKKGDIERGYLCTGVWIDKLFPGAKGTDIWLCGNITAIDDEFFTVQMPKPDLEEWPGHRYWKEAEGKAWCAEDSLVPATRAIVKRWLEGEKKDRTYRFKSDAAVGVFLNGNEATFSEIKPGDSVGVCYKIMDDKQNVIYPEYLRATRLD